MKILVTGGAGQLGKEIIRQLKEGGSVLGAIPKELQGCTITSIDLPDGNLASLSEARRLITGANPDIVINCAAFTNVDGCESQQDDAFAGNAIAPRNVAMACEEIGAKLVHVSTDYVLSGEADSPQDETAQPAPCSVYGKTKLLGENYVSTFCNRWFIVRTAWLYGMEGGNFVKTILKAACEKEELTVVDDQRGNPTNAEDLAHHILKLAATREYGIYHCTGNGICSWFEFASEIVSYAQLKTRVKPCNTSEYPRPAKRPAYSALDHAMLRGTIGDEMRFWKDALHDFLDEYIKKT